MNIVDYRVEWLPSVTNSVDVFLQQSSQQCGVMTILSEGAAGDFAAYRGIILDISPGDGCDDKVKGVCRALWQQNL